MKLQKSRKIIIQNTFLARKFKLPFKHTFFGAKIQIVLKLFTLNYQFWHENSNSTKVTFNKNQF